MQKLGILQAQPSQLHSTMDPPAATKNPNHVQTLQKLCYCVQLSNLMYIFHGPKSICTDRFLVQLSGQIQWILWTIIQCRLPNSHTRLDPDASVTVLLALELLLLPVRLDPQQVGLSSVLKPRGVCAEPLPCPLVCALGCTHPVGQPTAQRAGRQVLDLGKLDAIHGNGFRACSELQHGVLVADGKMARTACRIDPKLRPFTRWETLLCCRSLGHRFGAVVGVKTRVNMVIHRFHQLRD